MEKLRIFAFFLLLTICHARFISMPRQARLTLAEPMPYYFNNDINGHPGTYSYGYDVIDPVTGNNQFRVEERYPNGTVVGSYGYIDSRGRPLRYKYIADEKGYRVMRDPPYQPHRDPAPPVNHPSYPVAVVPLRPSEPNTESSITWTRPKKPNKKKENNYYVYRPTHNFVGPPSSYVEDEPVDPVIQPSYPAPVEPLRPSEPNPSVSSVTWTRPKYPNKKKNNNYYVHRPTHNFVGPPSSYAED